MFAALGNISFQVLASPTKLDLLQKYHYGKLDVIGSQPILQWIYDDLQEIKLEIYFHYYWCSPTDALKALQVLAATHQAQPFVLGNGFNLGTFVIDELQAKQAWMADNGNPLAMSVELSLMQYVSSSSAVVPAQMGASTNPPGVTNSQTSSPGAAIVIGPATGVPNGIPYQNPFTNVPASTIVRGY